MKISKEVQTALTRAGGKNLFGRPNYIFLWSADPDATYLISNGHSYERFRIIAEDCWLLMKWEAAEFWGSEMEWIETNREDSGLLTAGPYPREGRYRVVRPLKKMVIRDGVMTFEHPMPTFQFVDEIFPDLKAFLDLSTEKKADLLLAREKEEKESTLKAMAASRELYRGIATAEQIKKREHAIEAFISDPANQSMIENLNKRSV